MYVYMKTLKHIVIILIIFFLLYIDELRMFWTDFILADFN